MKRLSNLITSVSPSVLKVGSIRESSELVYSSRIESIYSYGDMAINRMLLFSGAFVALVVILEIVIAFSFLNGLI